MKTIFSVVLLLLVTLAPVPTARAQVTPQTIQALTNLYVTTTNQVAGPTNIIPLNLNGGLGFTTVFNASNLVTGNMYYFFYPISDGTNTWTTPFAILTAACNGTNAVIAGTNWSDAQLNGFTALVCVASNANTTFVTNYAYTITNGAKTYPAGITFNRPYRSRSY